MPGLRSQPTVAAWIGMLAVTVLTSGCTPSADHRDPKVFFLGIDGLSWTVMGRLLAAGDLPNFERLTREGAFMPDFDTMSSTASPVVWTTVATGREPTDHGITDFIERLPNGALIPFTNRARKAKAIWEVAIDNGVSVGVAGWWASWPAEEVDGWIITDHANPTFSELLIADRRYWTADTETLSSLQRDFLPADLGATLARHWTDKRDFDYLDFQRRSDITDEQLAVLRATPWNERSLYSFLKGFFLVDALTFRATLELQREPHREARRGLT